MKYKSDWEKAKRHHVQWWNRKGLAVSVMSGASEPHEFLAAPTPPVDLTASWTDVRFRVDQAMHRAANTYFGGDAVPMIELLLGPGSLGTFLGSEPRFAQTTVWYDPCIARTDSHGPIRFDPRNNKWWDVHLALLREGARLARGRCLVSTPDLVENIDTLAALRGTERLLEDLVERPAWVKQSVQEINRAFFQAFEGIFAVVNDGQGGNCFPAFGLWGPGKTAKVQCDFSCMISTAMFEEFVVPCLRAQCDWLDYSMYHLDGTGAMHQFDSLLAIESLDAIEWTPQAGIPQGGSPQWYDLYRRIRRGGKSVQAVGVAPEEVLPLIDAAGPEGLYVMTSAPDQAAAEALQESLAQFSSGD